MLERPYKLSGFRREDRVKLFQVAMLESWHRLLSLRGVLFTLGCKDGAACQSGQDCLCCSGSVKYFRVTIMYDFGALGRRDQKPFVIQHAVEANQAFIRDFFDPSQEVNAVRFLEYTLVYRTLLDCRKFPVGAEVWSNTKTICQQQGCDNREKVCEMADVCPVRLHLVRVNTWRNAQASQGGCGKQKHGERYFSAMCAVQLRLAPGGFLLNDTGRSRATSPALKRQLDNANTMISNPCIFVSRSTSLHHVWSWRMLSKFCTGLERVGFNCGPARCTYASHRLSTVGPQHNVLLTSGQSRACRRRNLIMNPFRSLR